MSITVADCLKLPSLRLGKVVAGKNGLNRVINTVSVLEIIDEVIFNIGKPVNNGEMILTSFYSLKDKPEEQCRYIEYMWSIGDTCIVLYYVGIFLKEIHPSVIETADRLDFPLIVMPEHRKDFLYNEVIEEVYEVIFRDRASKNDFIENVTSVVSRLPEDVRSIGTLLRIISAQMRVTLVLSDVTLTSVNISKWPVSNGITADKICNLYETTATKDEYCVEVVFDGMPMKIFCMPFTAFEYRNFSIYAVDEFDVLTLDDMFKIIEVLQIFSKIWELNANNILENALVPAIIEGDAKKMRILASKLNINVSSINTAIIIRPNFTGKDTKKQLQLKRDLISGAKNVSHNTGKNVIVDTYGLYIVCFTMFSTCKASDNGYIDLLIDALDDIYPDYTIAFFTNDDTVEDVRKTYLLYSEFVSSVLDIFPHKKELSYGDFVFARRCQQMIAEENDEYRICQNIIKPLFASRDSEELLDTLAVYHLDAECEIKKTAELLFLHRNTVQYRLNKIRGITNFKSGDILHSYLMHTAIACHRLAQKIK